jgi:hypothetical protein
MKNLSFIALVSLSLTVAASAAVQHSNENAAAFVTLPDYHVSTSRLTAAEKAVAQGLAEFRLQSRATPAVRTELDALGTVARQAAPEPTREIAKRPRQLVPARS